MAIHCCSSYLLTEWNRAQLQEWRCRAELPSEKKNFRPKEVRQSQRRPNRVMSAVLSHQVQRPK